MGTSRPRGRVTGERPAPPSPDSAGPAREPGPAALNGKRRIAIVGTGRLGSVLAVGLHRAGHPVVACASRTRGPAQRLAAAIPGLRVRATAAAAARAAQVVFLTVPDDAVAAVEAEIPWSPNHLAVHCSGALPASVLQSALAAGARAAAFHPLQTFADPIASLGNLPGSTVSIETSDQAWPYLAQIAHDLGARPMRIAEADRALYHLASVLVSNGVVGLVGLAAHLWELIGLRREDAVAALLPLLEGTVRNLHAVGIPAALTGPVARGDLGTIYRHVGALGGAPRELAVYRALSDWLIELALERGTITAEQAVALRAAIGAESEYEWRRPRR